MAAFSIQYQDHSFPLDSIFLPNTPINVTGFSGEPNTTTCFSQFCPQLSPIDGGIYENGVKADISNNETSVTNKNSTDSSSEEDYKHEIGEQVTQKVEKMEEKRKNRDGSSLSSTQSMDARELKRKRQKKSNVVIKDDKEKKTKADKKDQKKVPQEVPTGYVHVRARRGQATDSHSLAERLRREKISERMRILQSLVPGCDKITGKALMLDEIINYVQSLQNQVEFLSMKLASLNPICFDFGTNSDAFTLTLETERLNSLGSPVRNVENYNPAQPNVFSDTITIPDDYPPVDTSSSLLFDQQVQRPNILTQLLWDVDERRQKLINQSGFITNSLCSFH